MDVFLLLGCVLVLGLGFLLVALAIGMDRRRFLTGFDLASFRPAWYQSMASNFLQVMSDAGFRTPWPKRRNGLAAALFKWRLRPFLRRRPALRRPELLHQHFCLWALLDLLRPFLDQLILAQQQQIIQTRLRDMGDSMDRDRLVAFLTAATESRAAFLSRLIPPDRRILHQLQQSRFLDQLRTLNAVFQEHGFLLMPVLNQLRDWEDLCGQELVQQLPKLPQFSRRQSRDAYLLPTGVNFSG